MVQINDIDEMIKEYIRALIQSKYPNTDTSDASPIIDIISAPCVEIAKSMMTLGTDIEVRSNLNNAEDMSEEDMDEIGVGNYMLERSEGSKSIGTATMKFKSISDTQNTTIPSGVSLSTKSGLTFVSKTSISLTPAEMFQTWNSEDLTYDIEVIVEAEEAGSEYNIDAGQLTVIENGFTSYEISVTNNAAMVDGSDKESNTDYASRILKFLASRTLETSTGYEQDIKETFPEVKDVYVAGYEDPLMDRDLIESMTVNGVTYTDRHMGGKTDIYIRGMNVETATFTVEAKAALKFHIPELSTVIDATSIQVENTTSGQSMTFTSSIDSSERFIVDCNASTVTAAVGDTVTISYDVDTTGDGLYDTSKSTSYDLADIVTELSTPIIDITKIYNGTSEQPDGIYYSLDESDGDYVVQYEDVSLIGTSNEVTSISFTAYDNDTVVYGDAIEISYTYNKTINELDEHYNADENRVVTRDLLIKPSIAKYAHIGLSLKLAGDTVESSAIESAVSTVLTNMLDDVGIGSKIDESDIINELYTNDSTSIYVDYIQLPLSTFHFSDDPTDAFADGVNDGSSIQLGNIEYPTLQFANVTYI